MRSALLLFITIVSPISSVLDRRRRREIFSVDAFDPFLTFSSSRHTLCFISNHRDDVSFRKRSSCRRRNNSYGSSQIIIRLDSRTLPRNNVFSRGIVKALQTRNENRDDDDDDETDKAMADAFRQLELLKSLNDDDNDDSDNKNRPLTLGRNFSNKGKVMFDDAETPLSPPATLESELKLYENMTDELAARTEDGLYDELLNEMIEDTSATKEKQNTHTPGTSFQSPSSSSSSSDSSSASASLQIGDTVSTYGFLNKALELAMDEVKLNNPSIRSSILDNNDLRSEIEKIFDAGNEKLMAGLDEIRKEQREWARVNAQQTSQNAVDEMLRIEADRLEAADSTMQAMLQKVNRESNEVAHAMKELEKVHKELDQNVLVQLKSGGLMQQLSFVGAVLFSIRSIADTVEVIRSEGDMTLAFIEGGVALMCAVFFKLSSSTR